MLSGVLTLVATQGELSSGILLLIGFGVAILNVGMLELGMTS
jgi:hypothetical protein